MPTFKLDKLIRDKLREEYINSSQKAIYKLLSTIEHKVALKNKIK